MKYFNLFKYLLSGWWRMNMQCMSDAFVYSSLSQKDIFLRISIYSFKHLCEWLTEQHTGWSFFQMLVKNIPSTITCLFFCHFRHQPSGWYLSCVLMFRSLSLNWCYSADRNIDGAAQLDWQLHESLLARQWHNPVGWGGEFNRLPLIQRYAAGPPREVITAQTRHN